jgi:hypothetical protein
MATYTTRSIKPGREGYKILFNENTVIMNHKFAAAAAKYGTKENKLMKDIRNDFPGMKEVIVSGRVQTTAKANHRLTYKNMEKHIMVYENADELLEVFATVKAASVAVASPYKYVADWFKAQFPNYKDAVVFNDGKLTVAPVKKPDIIEYKQKMQKVS